MTAPDQSPKPTKPLAQRGPSIHDDRRYPLWTRRAALASDGTVFVSPRIMGDSNEHQAFLCASYDGFPVVTREGHVCLPAQWVKREDPDVIELVSNIEHKVRETLAEEG
jgi:hypothetical protein